MFLVLLVFALQGRIWLDLADGGFFWYGVIRTALGEIPIRDFQAYDPARYYSLDVPQCAQVLPRLDVQRDDRTAGPGSTLGLRSGLLRS